MKESIAVTMEKRMRMLLGGGELSRNWRERTLFLLDIYLVAGSCKKVRDNARNVKGRFPLIVRCIQYLDFKYVKNVKQKQVAIKGHTQEQKEYTAVSLRQPMSDLILKHERK